MICVSAAKLLFVGACLVPLQSLNRALDFPKVSVIVTAATLLAACARIALAAAGAGSWAPVIGNTAHGAFVFLGTLALSRHWPKPAWAWRECRRLVTFGLKLTSAGALYHFYREGPYFLIGRMLGTEILGLYRVAFDVAMIPATAVLTVVNRASFPVYARLAGDPPRLAETFTWNARNLALMVFPFSLLIGFMGPEILSLIGRTSQWADGGTALRVLCVAAALRCVGQFFPQLFAAAGRSSFSILDSAFSTVVFCGLFFFGLYLLGARFGILTVCVGWIAGYLLLFVPLWKMTVAIVPLRLSRFVASSFRDAAVGTAIAAVALLGALLVLHRFAIPAIPKLVVEGVVGAGAYLLWLRFGLKMGIGSLLGSRNKNAA
jgi:O-antigen/teichoic acid export membrane protein